MGGTGRRTVTIADMGVGTLDRAVAILDAVESGVHRFTGIMDATGIPRGTTHRLIAALEGHGFLSRYPGFGYRLGPRLLRLAHEAMRELPLRAVAHPSHQRRARVTGESAQQYVR